MQCIHQHTCYISHMSAYVGVICCGVTGLQGAELELRNRKLLCSVKNLVFFFSTSECHRSFTIMSNPLSSLKKPHKTPLFATPG